MALRSTAPRLSAQKLLVKQRMREREGLEFIPGRVLWDEVTYRGPGNTPIKPPAPLAGPLGWKAWFYERGLENHARTFNEGLFALKVNAALQDEFAKIEQHPPAEESHHDKGGKVLFTHQPIDSERKPQTTSSIPKDRYELQRFIDEKRALHASEKFSLQRNYDWQLTQEDMYRSPTAGSLSEDTRVRDEELDEDDHGRLLGGQIAQAFIFAWLTLIFISLVWRIK